MFSCDSYGLSSRSLCCLFVCSESAHLHVRNKQCHEIVCVYELACTENVHVNEVATDCMRFSPACLFP